MFNKTNSALLLVLVALMSMTGCITNVYNLNPCIKTIDVTTEQSGYSKTITATVAVTGNIQFDIKSPFNLERPLSMRLKVKSVQDNAMCDGRQEEAKNLVYSFNGVVPSHSAGERLLDAKKDFTKTN